MKIPIFRLINAICRIVHSLCKVKRAASDRVSNARIHHIVSITFIYT